MDPGDRWTCAWATESANLAPTRQLTFIKASAGVSACHGSLLQWGRLEMFELLPSISPLPPSRCSTNFVALGVKETIEQQLLAASSRRMGVGWVMDDATAAAVEGRWSALTREPSVTALTDEGQAANIDMRLTVSKTISAAESPSKTSPPLLFWGWPLDDTS